MHLQDKQRDREYELQNTQTHAHTNFLCVYVTHIYIYKSYACNFKTKWSQYWSLWNTILLLNLLYILLVHTNVNINNILNCGFRGNSLWHGPHPGRGKQSKSARPSHSNCRGIRMRQRWMPLAGKAQFRPFTLSPNLSRFSLIRFRNRRVSRVNK